MAQAALEDLRWHWGSAHLVGQMGRRWVAQRRDSHGALSAEGPDQLLGLIRAGCAAHPVPRDPRLCQLRPEGGCLGYRRCSR